MYVYIYIYISIYLCISIEINIFFGSLHLPRVLRFGRVHVSETSGMLVVIISFPLRLGVLRQLTVSIFVRMLS